MATLTGKRFIIIEDEYFIAFDLKRALEQAGAAVAKPVSDVLAAARLISAEKVDGAVVDVNLEGAESFPLVDVLIERSVPFLFLTGYDEWAMPERYRGFPRLSKPSSAEAVVEALATLSDR